MRSKRQLGAVGIATLMGFGMVASHASAAEDSVAPSKAKPVTLQLAAGDQTNLGKETYPGTEQSHPVFLEKDGRKFVVTVYMGSIEGEMYSQGFCNSIELTREGPKEVASEQITFTETGERRANHMRVATDGNEVVVVYGTDMMDPDTTATYLQVLDPVTCMPQLVNDEGMSMPYLVSDNPNNDCGAADIEYAGGKYIIGYLDAGGGGRSTAVAVTRNPGAMLTAESFDTNWRTVVHEPGNIGRPSLQWMGATQAGASQVAFVSALGKQRPPDYGIGFSVLDLVDGDIEHFEYIVESSKVEKKFYNQPHIVRLSEDVMVVQGLLSNGEGKGTNEKGFNEWNSWAIKYSSTNGVERLAHADDVDISWHTHASMCAGAFGVDGKQQVAIIGAPNTGIGQPTLQIMDYADNSFRVDPKNKFIVAEHGDAGHLSNLYGANPNNQGRDFLRCIGNVPNPGFEGGEGAMMPEVESFFVFPVSGKKEGQNKNSLFLSFVPGASSVELVGNPEAPVTEDPEKKGNDTGSTNTDNDQADGCSFSPGTGSAGGAALLGLALLGLMRRRRED